MARSKFAHGHQTKVGWTTPGSATCFNIFTHRLNSLCDSRVPVDVLAMLSCLFYTRPAWSEEGRKNEQEEKETEIR